jgi:glucokinase
MRLTFWLSIGLLALALMKRRKDGRFTLGNLALKVLASGGVYLGGGIPPRILPALEDERFMGAFQRKGRMSDLLARVPVHVILNPKVALLGAACHGLNCSAVVQKLGF